VLHVGTPPENFRQRENNAARSALSFKVGDDAAQYRAAECMLTARWIPSSLLLSGEHPRGHPAPAPTLAPGAIRFGFGTLVEKPRGDESVSPIRRIGVGGLEGVVSACTEIELYLRNEK
jgi:hypothetical protein